MTPDCPTAPQMSGCPAPGTPLRPTGRRGQRSTPVAGARCLPAAESRWGQGPASVAAAACYRGARHPVAPMLLSCWRSRVGQCAMLCADVSCSTRRPPMTCLSIRLRDEVMANKSAGSVNGTEMGKWRVSPAQPSLALFPHRIIPSPWYRMGCWPSTWLHAGAMTFL